MTEIKKVSNLTAFLILLLLALTWGTSFILIKKALIAFNPYQIAGLRVFIASLAFIPIILINNKKIDWSLWPFFIAVGLCGTLIPSVLFPLAQTKINSSMAGILNAIAPIFTLVIGIIFFKKAFFWRKGIGIALGFIGAAFLILAGNQLGIDENSWYGLFAILAGIFYSFSSNIIETYFSKMTALNISAASFGIMGPLALIAIFYFDAHTAVQSSEVGWLSLGYVTILSLFSTVMASIVFFYLIQRTSAVFSSTVAYLIPIIALMWGALDGELITLSHLVGMGLILVGVYFSKGTS